MGLKCGSCGKEADNVYWVSKSDKVLCRECYGIPYNQCGCDACIESHLSERQIPSYLLDEPLYRDDDETFEEVR